MDEVKVSSKFTKNLISKLVKRVIKKKIGCEVDVCLNGLIVTVTEGTAHIHLSVDAEVNKDELTKILGVIGL